MKAVILTGGLGTRLAPYTAILPKPLLPIGRVPILLIILRQLKNFGFTDVTMACGYLSELIQAYLMNNPISKEINIHYHMEEKPLGTAGALGSIDNLDEPFLVMNGDVLTNLDYSKLIEHHQSKEAALTIAVTQKKVQLELGILLMDSDNRLTGYDEKPTKTYPASTGIYIYDPRALEYIQPNEYLDAPSLVLKLIENNEKVLGYSSDVFWLDMGNHGDHERAIQEFEKDPSRFYVD